MNKHLDEDSLPATALTEGTAGIGSSVAHELRAPLVTILAQTEVLLADVHGPLTAAQSAVIGGIHDHARQALALITNLVELGRMAGNSMLLAGNPCDLQVIARDAARQAGEIMRSRSIEWDFECPSAPVHVTGDAAVLRQMISEFVHAALVTSAVGAKLQMSITLPPAGVRLQIQAYPSPSSAIEKPVEHSWAVRQWMKLRPIGTTLLRMLVQRHGGRLLIKESGQMEVGGLAIELPLPVLNPQEMGRGENKPPSPSADPAPVASAPPSGVPLILLADDQPMLLAVTRTYLESLGCRVETARDGLEALEMALRLQPDLIIMDVRMPMLDGPGAVARIRSAPAGKMKTVPIICASGTVAGDRGKCLAAGATDYLAKPYGVKEIDRLLANHLSFKHRSHFDP